MKEKQKKTKKEVYLHSKDLILHNTVATIRCDLCGLLNPNYIETEMPERSKPLSVTPQEIIDIDDSPIAPAKCRG